MYYNDSTPSAYLSVFLGSVAIGFILTTFFTMRLYTYVELIVFAYFPFLSFIDYGIFASILLTSSILHTQSRIACRELKAATNFAGRIDGVEFLNGSLKPFILMGWKFGPSNTLAKLIFCMVLIIV